MVRRDCALVALVLVVALTLGAPLAAADDDAMDGVASTFVGEPADVALALDYDVERIFRFVADEIRYEPYVGILRGAQRTLDVRAGNSVDQSLLLAAILDESAIPSRFVRGSLDEAAASGLIESIATDAAEARRIVEDDLARGLDEAGPADGTASGADGPLARLQAEEARASAAEAEARLESARTRLDETVATLETALDEAGIDLPAHGVTLPATEMVDHTWLQVPLGAEWLDLDPALAGAEAGTVMTSVSETLDGLPDDLRYRVDFEVLVERVQGGRLVTDVALELTAFADEIGDVPVRFGHVTPSGMERFGIALANVLGAGQVEYRPTFGVGPISLVADEPVAFGVAGIEAEGGLLGGTDLFADVAAPTAGAGPPDGEATAEWLTVSVTPPGSEPVVARRTVFDRLPEQLRHAGEMTVDAVEPIELADFDGTGSNDFLPLLGIEAFAIATGPTSAATILERLRHDELGAAASAYHTLRDAMGSRIGLDAGARTFVDGPDIVSLSLDIAGDAQSPSVLIGLDIWHRNQGILPLTGVSATAPEAELVAGVSAHLVERFTLEGLPDAPGLGRRTIGVGELFETAATQGIPTRILKGSEPGSLPYAPVATQLLEDTLTSGDVVFAPAEPVVIGDTERAGWWRIDPETGVTHDVMDDGSGQEVVEYATLQSGRARQIACFGSMANWAAGSIIAAAAMVATLSESAIFRLFNHPSGWGGVRCFAL